jgi:hypothetical protein
MKTLALMSGLLLLPPQDPVKTSFAVLSSFTWEAGSKLPDEVTKLDDKVVVISGSMRREVPGGDPVEEFMLVNDACGCTGTPKMNEIVFCVMPEKKTTDIKPGIVTVKGHLYVGEQKEGGDVWCIYQLDVESIQ